MLIDLIAVTMVFAAAAVPDSTIEVVTDAQMWALVVGFVSPLLIATIQQPRWSNPVRVGVAAAWSILAGGGTAWFNDEFTGRGILSSALVVLVTAIATYQHLWKPAHITTRIEAATSPRSRIVEQPVTHQTVVPDEVVPPTDP